MAINFIPWALHGLATPFVDLGNVDATLANHLQNSLSRSRNHRVFNMARGQFATKQSSAELVTTYSMANAAASKAVICFKRMLLVLKRKVMGFDIADKFTCLPDDSDQELRHVLVDAVLEGYRLYIPLAGRLESQTSSKTEKREIANVLAHLRRNSELWTSLIRESTEGNSVCSSSSYRKDSCGEMVGLFRGEIATATQEANKVLNQLSRNAIGIR